MSQEDNMNAAYKSAKEKYSAVGVDADTALSRLKKISLSVHCWQADDVGGFEHENAELEGGGIQVTGNYPGKSRTLEELKQDFEKVYSLVPGTHRLSLHASYGDMSGASVDRDEIGIEHFESWLEWGGKNNVMLDFNATLFSHPRVEDGFTLSSKKPEIRAFWIEHVKRSREIAAYIGKMQGSPCVHNLWIPDGSKDIPVDRFVHREYLKNSLDEIFEQDYPRDFLRDAVESKLFGIGSESFVAGSHEFYMGYAFSRNKLLCLDMGHFHPTESVADKISSYFQFQDELLLHVSRPVRWDSDHVVVLNDDINQLMQELVRADLLDKTHIGLDFFDATINRIGAYAIGSRATLKSLLFALLEPRSLLKQYDDEENYFARLAMLEEAKLLPLGEVWNEFCRQTDVVGDRGLIDEVMQYEREILSRRTEG